MKSFKTPTLVVHGELDYRVPLEQGLGMFTALQAPRRAQPPRDLPRREPLGAEAGELAPLVRRGAGLARPLVPAVRGHGPGAATLALGLGLMAGAGCSRRSLPGVVVEEIANPTAPGSGEASLSALPDGRAILSWIEPAGEGNAVRLAVRERDAWSEPRTIARSANFFVNWADFPTVAALGDGTLFAHWLEKNTAGKYSYVVKLARSRDLGRSWSEPLVPHADTSAVEHGFVSMADDGAGRMALVWLDGRDPGGTALLATRAPGEGPVATEERVDGRVCDCCQTALIRTSRGLLAAFRDRSEGEVRDIAISRFEGGAWSPAQVVARDGWRIDGCPVNGPALAVGRTGWPSPGSRRSRRPGCSWPSPRTVGANGARPRPFTRDGQWGGSTWRSSRAPGATRW